MAFDGFALAREIFAEGERVYEAAPEGLALAELIEAAGRIKALAAEILEQQERKVA